MAKAWLKHAPRVAVLLALGLAFAAATLSAGPRPGARRRAMQLFAGALGEMNVNRFECGLDAFGKVCVDPAGSTTVGGGFWPKGSAGQYVFNSGLQLAGIVDPALTTFPWAGDTIGAFFFDPKGTTEHGDDRSGVWSSLNSDDFATWPRDAFVPNDPSLYNEVLIGRKAASQQDTWIQYWDGNPSRNAGRKHPLGVLVTQRGLAWNFPVGNEDIIYYVYSFTNITASDPAVYTGLTDADTLASVGAQFQALNEAAFGVDIPNTGYTIRDMYAAFAMDADVSDAARENYSTAFLPFNMGTAFKKNWYAPEMSFPASIFGAPFAAAPGIVGVKYLRSPIVGGQEVGLTMFGNTINGGQFDDAQNTSQLWRYLSANLNPTLGDAPCNAPLAPDQGKVCFITQTSDDIRFFQSSGPLDLAPGETKTIVVAYIVAAPVDVPAIALRGANLDLKPAWPAQATDLALGLDTLRSVDRVFGAVTILPDANGNGKTDQDEVATVPRSLLNKGLVAQAVFDARFLLPFPPQGPEFYLVPGDNQVTVVWSQSPTETDGLGDPFFEVASDPTNPAIYNPNYRQFDVEGYRIYRGRTSGDVELVVQFDYSGTTMVDYTGAFDYGNCAPEIPVTTDCPNLAAGVSQPLVGRVVQIPSGGRVELANGDVLVLQADTAPAMSSRTLEDGGVPFAYVDKNVRNSFTYHYAVTAFDINSVASVGPANTALESPRVTKSVTPRASGSNAGTGLGPVTLSLVGGGGETLDPSTGPTINATNGTFSGPAAPTAGLEGLELSVFAADLVAPNAQAFIRVDSVVSRWYHTATYFLSGIGPVVIAGNYGPAGPLGEEEGQAELGPATAVLPADSNLAKSQGLGPVPLAAQHTGQARLSAVTYNSKDADWHPDVDGAFFEAIGITDVGGSRWFDGANETMADPTLGLAHGQLTGVTAMYRPVRIRNASNLFRRFDQTTYHVFRAADIKVYWGATPGTVDSVVDVTHHVRVPFDPQNRASYGFRDDVAGADDAAPSAPDGIITYNDFLFGACMPGAGDVPGATSGACDDRDYQPAAALGNVDVTGDKATDGTGFGMYINGEPFVFRTATLPSSTVWTYRSYSGLLGGTTGAYTFTRKASNPAVPGLRLAITTSTPAVVNRDVAGDLSRVHTVPDPYYVTNAFEQSPNTKVLRFVNLPARAIIRIYSQSGVLLNALTLDDPTGGGEVTWNLRNRNNQFVASGVYFYHVETPDGKSKVGRFTIVNYAQ